MNRYRHSLPIVFILAALLGCQKDTPVTGGDVPAPVSGVLKFGISQENSWKGTDAEADTKAPDAPVAAPASTSFRSEALLMDCDDPDSPLGEVYIYMVEEDYSSDVSASQVATRAEGEGEGEGATPEFVAKYGVYAYQGEGEVPVSYDPASADPFTQIQNLALNEAGQYDGESAEQYIYAPGSGTWLQFFAYSPYMSEPLKSGDPATNYLAVSTDGQNYPVINYTALTTDHSKHVDLLYAKSAATSGEVTEPIALDFKHILSKIKVMTGTIAAGTVTSISIEGVHSSGTINGNSLTWTATGEANSSYSKTSTSENVAYDELYLVPQTLTNAAVIELKVRCTTGDGVEAVTREYTLTKSLTAFITDWLAGKQYTFVISTPNEVEVTVTDDVVMDGTFPVKKNLKITNTGLADAYIRVAIHGAWVVDEDDKTITMSEWKAEDDGDYVWTGKSADWYEYEGYYYYLVPIKPGESAGTLFDSYTLTADAPVLDSYLQMTILAQAVYIGDVDKMFPPAVMTEVNNKKPTNP